MRATRSTTRDSVLAPFPALHGEIHCIHCRRQSPGEAIDYYDIELTKGGTLLVPLTRATTVGLRRLVNGLQAIESCLGSPAQELPDNNRQRAAALRERELTAEPTALARAVRDLLAWCAGRKLSQSEKVWLEKSCECLSTEAALVDHITLPQARAAIREAVTGSAGSLYQI